MGASIDQRYFLGGGSPEVERLRIQSLALEPHVESLLDELGVSVGSMALDLACGPVGLLRPLSARVGASGKVVGMDLDPAEVSAAQEMVRTLALPNVEVIQGDAFHTQLRPNSFDLVHARFLIAPVGRPHDLVTEALRVTKPGGILLLEEPVASAWSCFPESIDFERLKEEIRQCFRLAGGDFDAGRTLFSLLRGSGLSQVRSRGVALTLYDGHPYMRSAIQFATSLRKRIVDHGIMTESDLERTVAGVERAIAQPETSMISFLVIQAWGRKPIVSPSGR